jgi:hypothetical protein
VVGGVNFERKRQIEMEGLLLPKKKRHAHYFIIRLRWA